MFYAADLTMQRSWATLCVVGITAFLLGAWFVCVACGSCIGPSKAALGGPRGDTPEGPVPKGRELESLAARFRAARVEFRLDEADLVSLAAEINAAGPAPSDVRALLGEPDSTMRLDPTSALAIHVTDRLSPGQPLEVLSYYCGRITGGTASLYVIVQQGSSPRVVLAGHWIAYAE